MAINGSKLRCIVPDCFSPLDFLVEHMCERHYRMHVIEPLTKTYNKARLQVEFLAGKINDSNNRIRQAKAEYGIVDPKPMMFCSREGCTFKSPFWNVIEEHQRLCAKKAKSGKPRKVKIAVDLDPQDMTDFDDLDDEDLSDE